MKKYILILFFTPFLLLGQKLDCNDFLKGEFIGSSPEFPGVEWKIIRTKTNQKEWPSKIPQKYIDMGMPLDTVYSKINRVDKCNYRFMYDEHKMKLKGYQKEMNSSGGILVYKDTIIGNCFYYTSKAFVDNKEIIIQGKICKVE